MYEHNYVLQQRIDQARTSETDLCMGFMDFSNAFGSILHHAITEAVQTASAGAHFTDIVTDLYRDNITGVLTGGGSTNKIPMRRGITQGCPLSSPLFNMGRDPILRQVQGTASDHALLAYADDITPIADSSPLLQERISKITDTTRSLRLNPSKYRSLHVSGSRPVGVLEYETQNSTSTEQRSQHSRNLNPSNFLADLQGSTF